MILINIEKCNIIVFRLFRTHSGNTTLPLRTVSEIGPMDKGKKKKKERTVTKTEVAVLFGNMSNEIKQNKTVTIEDKNIAE